MTPPLAVLPVPSAQAQQVVVVRSGETLSEIADRHGVSISRLMQANGISDADLVVVGQRLTIPGSGSTARASSAPSTTQGTAPYTVKNGETLSEIADRFNTTTARLIQINAIRDPDLVMSGTRLQVPMPARTSTPAAAAAPAVNRNASEHVVQPGESLSVISERYGTSVSRLVALNQLDDPELVMAGTRLKLRGTPPAPRSAPLPASQAKAATTTPASTPGTKPAATAAVAAAGQQTPTIQSTAVQATPAQPVLAQPSALRGTAAQPSAPLTTATQSATAQAANAQAAAAQAASAKTTAASAASSAQPALNQARSSTSTAAASAAAASTAPASIAAASTAATATATATATSVAARPTPAKAPATLPTAANPASAKTTALARPAGDWRNYGPLQVDWSKIQPMGGSYVAPSLNSDGQTLYLAVNCTARKINLTSQAGQWRTWENPSKDFEHKLVLDICQAKST
jgi:LysM repeat protein